MDPLVLLYILAWVLNGIYMIYAVIRYRKDLNAPSAEVRYSVPSYIANIIGLSFFLVSLPLYYTKWREMPEIFLENPAYLFFVLFTLVGVGFLSYGLWKTFKGMKV